METHHSRVLSERFHKEFEMDDENLNQKENCFPQTQPEIVRTDE